jgi:PhnB protein
MIRISPYLRFNGHCEAAFKFYEKCLGAKIETMQAFGASPMAEQVPANRRNKIMHATLRIGDDVLMGSDSTPEEFEIPQGFSITLTIDDPTAADRAFGALADGGTIEMPIQETFWAKRFGMLIDRYGVSWMISSNKN